MSTCVSEALAVLHDDLVDLSSAEDFLNYFGIEFDQAVVYVNRLHILQRFHDYLKEREETLSPELVNHACYQGCLQRAYLDFVGSDAATEKVFKVFKQHASISPKPLTLVQIER